MTKTHRKAGGGTTLPEGYRGGCIPELPPRDEIVLVAAPPGYHLIPGIQPEGVKTSPIDSDRIKLEVLDETTRQMMIFETQTRDRWADKAFSEMLGMIEGQELTAELLHRLRLRLRQFGDDAHCLAKIQGAHINQRGRSRTRSKLDPIAVCQEVRNRIRGGTTTSDAFIEIAEEHGVASETIRNAYYKHRDAPIK
jgi:hypothetical protein